MHFFGQVDLSWASALVPFISAGAGAYVGSYLKKKGENLATHEDIENLREQVRVVTTTTKEIEAKISNEVWDRQKKWELKREVLFEAAKRLAEIDEALVGLDATLQIEQKPDDAGWAAMVAEKHNLWRRATIRFEESNLLVAIVCGNETKEAFDKLRLFTDKIVMGIIKSKDADIYRKSGKELAVRLFATRAAVRRELGIDSNDLSRSL
jgi:hypothetical protein